MRGRSWTEKDDEIVRTNSTKVAAKLLWRRHSLSAVRSRRAFLETAKLRWTPAEDEIVISNTIDAAMILLGGSRSKKAVAFRRRTLGAIPKKLWTKAQDRRIRETAGWTLKKALKAFRGRTSNAIQIRRRHLGCALRAGKVWTGKEVKLLRQMWPNSNLSDVVKALPRHPQSSIKSMACDLNLRTIRTFDQTDLLDQIRSRAHEDGISGKRLVAEVGCGGFIFARRPNSRLDFSQISKVVEFFGGRLVIDWCDE